MLAAMERDQVPSDLIGRRNSTGDPVPKNLYPIFRDEEEMRAGLDLNELIAAGLQRSNWLTRKKTGRMPVTDQLDRSVCIGSMRMALRVGPMPAAAATPRRMSATAP
jgi:hypothetical protein